MRTPAVSIGMPIYNGERYLSKSIESVLAQSFEDFELIISDNASTDDTEHICYKYLSQDSRIKYFRNEVNLGAAKNFNRTFELSSAPFFRWQSADDVCAPTLVEQCREALSMFPKAVLCAPRTSLVDSEDVVLSREERGLEILNERPSERIAKLMTELKFCNAAFGLMRSEAMRNTRLEGDYPGSDTIFLLELALQGPFVEIPEYLFFRRMHARAFSSLVDPEARQRFWEPERKRSIYLREFHLFFERFRSVLRSPIGFVDKLRSASVILTRARWQRSMLLQELLGVKNQFIRSLAKTFERI